MPKKQTLNLHLKAEYFDAIQSGEKTEEYRAITPYWEARLNNPNLIEIKLLKGYPAKQDHARQITLPYRGYRIKTISHPQFGNFPQCVFAIKLTK